MAETLLSDLCCIYQNGNVIVCITKERKSVCPKEFNKGLFRKECIGL